MLLSRLAFRKIVASIFLSVSPSLSVLISFFLQLPAATLWGYLDSLGRGPQDANNGKSQLRSGSFFLPHPPSRPLEEASALAFSLTSASREAESEASGWDMLRFLIHRHCEIANVCFRPLSFGIICYTAIDAPRLILDLQDSFRPL